MDQNPKKYDYLFKIVSEGDSGVGKTCLSTMFIDHTFTERPQLTIGVEFRVRVSNIFEDVIKFQVWDLNGAERFYMNSHYRRTHGIILMYDITNKESFCNLNKWYQNILKGAPENVTVIVVGNKADLEDKRAVTIDEAKEFANNIGCTYMETSAKTGMNVDELFGVMAKKIIAKVKAQADKSKLADTINLREAPQNPKKKQFCNSS